MDVVLSGSAHPALAAEVARELGVPFAAADVGRFPDGELRVVIPEDDVRGRFVALVQPTSPPVTEHLVELLLLADACRRAGASRVGAFVPYLGFSRHERRAHPGEPIAARVVADMLGASPIEHLVAVDLHVSSLEGFFSFPVEHLTALPVLVQALRSSAKESSVIVSPDLGGVKRAEAYARKLNLPLAVVHKSRLSGAEVAVHELIGDVRGRTPLIVDDMISTGATVCEAIAALSKHGCAQPVTVVASHAIWAGDAVEKFRRVPIERVITTDSVPQPKDLGFRAEVVPIAPLLAEAAKKVSPVRGVEPLTRAA